MLPRVSLAAAAAGRPLRVSVPAIASLRRCYVGLAFNSTQDKDKASATATSSAPVIDPAAATDVQTVATTSKASDIISSVSAGINAAARWIRRPAIPDPEFSVISSGLGAMVHVKMPEGSRVYTAVGSVVGMANRVESSISTEGGPLRALARLLAGGNFVLNRLSATAQPGDVLLAPKALGDVAAIQLDGSTDYFLRRNAFLACSPHLALTAQPTPLAHIRDSGLFTLRVTGKGTLAITTYGGLFRLVLEDGEEYIVSRRHLVAWDTAMTPRAIIGEQVKPGNVLQRALSRFGLTVKHTLLRDQDLVRLSGPGDFYVSSRIEPRFEGLKSLGRSSGDGYLTVPSPAVSNAQAPKTSDTPNQPSSRDDYAAGVAKIEAIVLPPQPDRKAPTVTSYADVKAQLEKQKGGA